MLAIKQNEDLEVDQETRDALADFYHRQNERHNALAERVTAVETMKQSLESDIKDIKEKQSEHRDLIDGIVKEQNTLRLDQVRQYGDLKIKITETYHAAADSVPKWFAEQQAQKEATSSTKALWVAAGGAVIGAVIAAIALLLGHGA